MQRRCAETELMVYVKQELNKKPRTEVVGKLVSISSDAKGVIDQADGLFKYLDFTVVKEDVLTAEGKPKFFNIRVSGVNRKTSDGKQEKVPIDLKAEVLSVVARADALLREKRKPMVSMTYYESDAIRVDAETGVKQVFTNLRASVHDLKDFMLLDDGVAAESLVEVEPGTTSGQRRFPV